MLTAKKFLFNIFLIIFVFAPGLVLAEITVAPELYVSSKGIAEIHGAQVIGIHALNLISVGIWGQKWTVSMDYATKFQSSDGTEIKPEQIVLGHILGIKAVLSKQQQGVLEALVIRDLSIGTGSTSGSLFDLICPVPTSSPSSTSSISSAPPSVSSATIATSAVLLTRTIALGAKGLDVATLQEFLQKKGFGIPDDGPVTGYFGKVTEQAVKKFQEASGLEAIGSVGVKTRALINSVLNIR